MNTSPLSDEKLVVIARNNVDQFGVLIERYEQKLLRYVMRISNFCYESAEEIVQDTFLKTWKNLNGFDEAVKFSSWVYRIAHNETISAFRKMKSRGRDQSIELTEELFIAEKEDFRQALDTELSIKNIHTILTHMDCKYREVLILKFLEEKSYDEISDILQKSSGTIATLISRAKKQFRKLSQRHNISFL
jgi:RNA polymerase sigma-70 factor (ECF subfamily)